MCSNSPSICVTKPRCCCITFICYPSTIDNEAPVLLEVVAVNTKYTASFYSDVSVLLQETAPPSTHSAFSGHHLPFVGFTFSKDSALSDVSILRDLSGTRSTAVGEEVDSVAVRAYEKRILKLEQENKETSRKLVGMFISLGGNKTQKYQKKS